jgi:hypothetical protein
MLDVPGQPVLDKAVLIGTCARLPVQIDVDRLRNEVNALPLSFWGTTGGRVGVHRAADAVFLRGHAPAEGDLPVEDRPALTHLPYAHGLIHEAFGAPPLRCLLARLPAGASIAPHIDRALYFAKSLRLHFPVVSHDQAWMMCGGLSYLMRPGEAWALNNSTTHAVWNAHPTLARTHMICDFLPSPMLLALLERADRTLGRIVPEVDEHLAGQERPAAAMPG